MHSIEHEISRKGLGTFLIGESLLIWVPLILLGVAIEWPASLAEPAEVILPQLLEKSAAITVGYFAYLVYSILFFPMAYLLIAYLEGGAYGAIWDGSASASPRFPPWPGLSVLPDGLLLCRFSPDSGPRPRAETSRLPTIP